jgi:hypothetical protein
MPTSEEYRQTAEEYVRLAGEAKTEADRVACLDVAHSWLEAASRQEAMTPAQIAEVRQLALETKEERDLQRERETQPRKPRTGWRRLFGLLRKGAD